MITEDGKQQIAESLRRLAESQAQSIRDFQSVLTIFSREFEMIDSHWPIEIDNALGTSAAGPVADWATLSVHWRGRTCFFGNTLPFRFFE